MAKRKVIDNEFEKEQILDRIATRLKTKPPWMMKVLYKLDSINDIVRYGNIIQHAIVKKDEPNFLVLGIGNHVFKQILGEFTGKISAVAGKKVKIDVVNTTKSMKPEEVLNPEEVEDIRRMYGNTNVTYKTSVPLSQALK